ncbi:MAG: S41 family peptidase [Myxococcota bacterium]|nr:S41 family peptidase [Myxococcota bacterium]
MVGMVRRVVWMAVGTAALIVVLLSVARWKATVMRSLPAPPRALAEETSAEHAPQTTADDARTRAFRIPTGQAPALSCEAARAIVAQARSQLAYPPDPVDAKALAEAAADWLDPYGLWSVAPDTPIAESFERRAADLLADLEGRGSTDCAVAHELGSELVIWVSELRTVFDESFARTSDGEDMQTAAAATAFEGATVTRPARALAATLGRRIGVIERELGASAQSYGDRARGRYFPPLDTNGWARVVLAAAVRAYVPTIDPHGAWAPLDEESSVYEVDLEARPPSRLWDKSDRTALGVRIESGAAPPLADGDVVLSLAGMPTGGLSFEQTEQLGFAACDARPSAQAVVLRPGERLPLTTWLDGTAAESSATGGASEDGEELPIERVEYGDGDAVIVAIHDVRDDLGDALTRALLHQREQPGRPMTAVVLDLRGNGGGSTDGAIDALGLFIPGAPLFPMKRRDGSLETDRAPEPPVVDRWRGPVASFVDGDTASAAEMIAGALAAYRRGPTVGGTTFGKGCAQEYIDDDAHTGTLRLTTLLYALPDGTPVQRVGLMPTIRFPFGAVETSDRESALLHSPPVWRGPDVRDRAVLGHGDDGTWSAAWLPHGGNVGPCKDPDVCRALRMLGLGAPTARRAPRARATTAPR